MVQMKDSGVEWIGYIPVDWKISKIDTVYSPRNVKVSDNDYPPLSVTMKGIVPQLESAAKTNAHDSRKLVKKGDFAINSRSDRRGSCGISEYTGSVSLINTVLKPTENMIPRYFNWLFHTSLFADEFYKWGHGIVDDLWSTGWQEMRKISIPFPKLSVQQQIANFLDKKCAEIDSLSEDIQKEIDLLEEYKKSVITEAVTKGLNPDVEMKDSGVEWIGEIPNEWTTTRLKFLLENTMKYGAAETGVEYSEDLPRYIRITDITTDNKLKENGKLSLTRAQALGYLLEKETILFARSGGTVGKTFFYRPQYGEAAFAGYLISATPNKSIVNPKWIYYFTLSNAYWDWVNRVFTQATIQNIGADRYSNMQISLPKALSEQNKISDFLDKKCTEIDKIITEKQEQLTILSDYKKSLIYEYVTGKKEVI